MIESILRDVGNWIFITKEFKGLSVSMFSKDWPTSISTHPPMVKRKVMNWMPPQEGVLKLNFDGSSKGYPTLACFGCVVRDCTSSVIHVISGPLGICESTKAEAVGLFMGLRELKRMGVQDCMVEGDLAVVIGWSLGKGDGSWQLEIGSCYL